MFGMPKKPSFKPKKLYGKDELAVLLAMTACGSRYPKVNENNKRIYITVDFKEIRKLNGYCETVRGKLRSNTELRYIDLYVIIFLCRVLMQVTYDLSEYGSEYQIVADSPESAVHYRLLLGLSNKAYEALWKKTLMIAELCNDKSLPDMRLFVYARMDDRLMVDRIHPERYQVMIPKNGRKLTVNEAFKDPKELSGFDYLLDMIRRRDLRESFDNAKNERCVAFCEKYSHLLHRMNGIEIEYEEIPYLLALVDAYDSALDPYLRGVANDNGVVFREMFGLKCDLEREIFRHGDRRRASKKMDDKYMPIHIDMLLRQFKSYGYQIIVCDKKA